MCRVTHHHTHTHGNTETFSKIFSKTMLSTIKNILWGTQKYLVLPKKIKCFLALLDTQEYFKNFELRFFYLGFHVNLSFFQSHMETRQLSCTRFYKQISKMQNFFSTGPILMKLRYVMLLYWEYLGMQKFLLIVHPTGTE